ncbi:putative integral membrane protein [Ilyonectria robusta]
MKLLLFTHFVSLLFAWGIRAEQYDSYALSRLPECSKTCIANVISVLNCTAQDDTCLCTDESIIPAASLCILQSCSVKQALSMSFVAPFPMLLPNINKLCKMPPRPTVADPFGTGLQSLLMLLLFLVP